MGTSSEASAYSHSSSICDASLLDIGESQQLDADNYFKDIWLI